MLLPTTETAVLVALVISLIGWGSWAALFKAGKKVRFEFFLYDFAFGVALAAVVAAFTLGLWNPKELTFQDNLLLTGLRKEAWAIGSGLVFALANSMLLASVSVSGMSVAFPITFGVAWALGSVWDFVVLPGLNPMMAFGGAVLVGALMAVVAYRWYLEGEAHKAVEALRADPRAKAAPKTGTGTKAFILAAVSGVLFTGFFYAIQEATSGDNGIASYGAALFLAAGAFGASIVVVPFFLNFPVKGQPLTVRRYFTISALHHVVGLVGGMVWTMGLLGGLATLALPAAIQPLPLVRYLLTHGTPLLAALWGLFVWREMKGGSIRVHAMMGAMFVLMLAGMGMIALAPGYGL
jgi:glucose uptake protein